jgi:WD repeat-containing protein 13
MQWSTTNDLIASASLDGTTRVWQVARGKCMRVLKDTCGAQVICCCFQPLNENMIVASDLENNKTKLISFLIFFMNLL